MHLSLLLCASFMASSTLTAAQETDSLQRSMLEEIIVSGSKIPSSTKSISPTQVVSTETLERMGGSRLSDAVKYLSGITLKDYGGVGGMKTVSARGLGSQLTTLCIDGVAVSDAMNGQVDLGRYLLGGSAFISFSHGQTDEQMLAARGFAAGNVLNMESRPPQFFLAERTNLHAGIEVGSFGLLSPTIHVEQKLSNRLSASIFANLIRSDGDYPFTLYYTQNHSDSSSQERRQNSQMWMFNADANLFYRIDTRHQFDMKLHLTKSNHHLPGPVVFYTVKSSEKSASDIGFVQGKYRWKSQSKCWDVQLLGKYQQSLDSYDDTLTHLSNRYRQREGYLSSTLRFSPTSHFSATLANDGALNTLQSNKSSNTEVTRLTTLHVLAAKMQWPNISVQGNLLLTNCHESTSSDTRHSWIRLSPYIGASVVAWHMSDTILRQSRSLHLRYFFKETYRTPNFSELYFADLHSDLRPEKALQHNIGITYSSFCDSLTYALRIGGNITIDAYYNRVSDKIIAIPTQSLYLWSMTNMGQADIVGGELKADLSVSFNRWSVALSASYTYQNATDRSRKDSKTYGHQIAYIPRHSATAAAFIETPYIDFGYNATFVGQRYTANQNTEKNQLPAYADQGITLSHSFNLRLGTLRIQGEVGNLFDVQYEIVKNYPMMGRNFKVSATYDF